MNINLRFNKFYHSLLNDLFRKSTSLIIRELLDTRTNGAFKIVRQEDYHEMDDLKQLLKLLNLDYKVAEDENSKLSTKDIDNKYLLDHIEWIFKLASNNGITLQVVQDEWDYLINYYKDK